MRLGYIGISGRDDIPRHLNEMNMTGIGVEIGTHKGEFAAKILKVWQGKHLYCVDSYENSPEYTADGNAMEQDRTPHRQAAEQVIEAAGRHRATLLRATSSRASTHFELSILDFVYVDGNHNHEYVYDDLNLWWPKIKPGGLMMGHDFICPGEFDGGWGTHVQQALDRFCKWAPDNFRCEIEVCPIPELSGLPWSFAIRKPKQ